MPPRKSGFFSRPAGVITLVALVVLLVGGVGGFFVARGFLRHGVPGDIPLPDQAQFVRQVSYGQGYQEWYYTVATTTAPQIGAFYQAQLPSNGWTEQPDQAPVAQDYGNLWYTKGSQRLNILLTTQTLQGLNAPDGGVALAVALFQLPSGT
jgi:hypothetical protein